MENLSCHSNQTAGATAMKNTIFIVASIYLDPLIKVWTLWYLRR